jgi:phenylacetate-CoA ligase
MIPTFVAKNLYYFSLLLRGRYKIIENYEFLRKKSYEPREVILKEQWERLRNILIYSYKEIPYYHRIFDEHNVNLDNLTVEEFQKIPFLTKEIIRKEFNNLYRIRPGVKWYYHSTSGSTGEPITVIQDIEYSFWEAAVKHLFDEWALHKVGEPMIALWSLDRYIFPWSIKLKKFLAHNLFYNKIFLDPKKLSVKIIKNYFKIIDRSNAEFMLAYPGRIYELSCFAEENKLSVKPFKSIMTSAEALFPYMRETIERVFQCPVFNRYGSNEVGDIASECADHKGLHVSAYTHYVEIIKEDGTPCKDGEQGEVVITLLTNFTMPLIRYKIGDMAVKTDEKCSCGKGLPLIKDIIGRTIDLFVNSNRELVSGMAFDDFFREHAYIIKYQIIQEKVDEIDILVVLNNSDITKLQEDVSDLENEIKSFMGINTKVNLRVVDCIELGPSGKYRFVISKVFRKF